VMTGYFQSAVLWYRPIFRMSGIVGLLEKAKSMVGTNASVVQLGRARSLVSKGPRDRI